MRRSRNTCLSSDSGSLLLDAVVTIGIVSLFASLALVVARAQREGLQHAAGMPAINVIVDADVTEFLANPYDVAPIPNSGVAGSTDAGETIYAMHTGEAYADLGLRTLEVAAFGNGVRKVVVGGASRLEPLQLPPARPDMSGIAIGPSSHRLNVRSGTPSMGRVEGSGVFPFGQSVPIRAIPFPYKHFVRWEGTAIIDNPSSASTTVTVDEDRTISAVFAP